MDTETGQRGAGAVEVNTVSAETRGHAMMVMTTVKKVYILLWKNLIIKVWILFAVYTITQSYSSTRIIL